MQMTWQERGSERRSNRGDFSVSYRSSVGKSSGRRRSKRGSPGRISESLRLPGSRNDGENPKLYLTEGKMGDRFDSRGGGLLLPSSAREDISTGRSDKTSISGKSNEKKNRALLRVTNLKFCTKTNLSKQIKMKGGT